MVSFQAVNQKCNVLFKLVNLKADYVANCTSYCACYCIGLADYYEWII